MEPHRKLMKLSSRCMKNAVYDYDRLSDLPDEMIHHIISLLGPNDIVSLSSSSTRLRLVCLCCPYLSLSLNCKSETSPSVSYSRGRFSRHILRIISSNCTKKCRLFRGFMNRFLNSHDGKEINRFSLHWSCNELDKLHNCSLHRWIRKALDSNLHELDINLRHRFVSRLIFRMPNRNYINGQPLRVLKLQLSNDLLGLPFESFPSLENLRLESVEITTKVSLGNWVSKYCKSLKKLTLKNVTGIKKLSIQSSCLEELAIYNASHEKLSLLRISTEKLKFLHLKLQLHPTNDCSIIIYAPCLQYFTRVGTPVRYTCEGGFRSLHNGTIILHCAIYYNAYAMDTYVADLLQSVRWARVLHLNFGVIKSLFRTGQLPILFENVHHLLLEYSRSRGYEIPLSLITFFLKGLPCLNTLTIKCARKTYLSYDTYDSTPINESAEFGDSQNSVVSQLKEVEIELLYLKHGIRLVKYLLKHANKLEKMTIFYPRHKFKELSSLNLQNLDRTSSSVEIFLRKKDFIEE